MCSAFNVDKYNTLFQSYTHPVLQCEVLLLRLNRVMKRNTAGHVSGFLKPWFTSRCMSVSRDTADQKAAR